MQIQSLIYISKTSTMFFILFQLKTITLMKIENIKKQIFANILFSDKLIPGQICTFKRFIDQ